MNLFFPQWQGSGPTNKIYEAAQEAKKFLGTKYNFSEIKELEILGSHTENNIQNYQSLLKNIDLAKEFIEGKNPKHYKCRFE